VGLGTAFRVKDAAQPQRDVERSVVALMCIHVLLSAMTYLAAKRSVAEIPPLSVLSWRLLVSASIFAVLLAALPKPRLPPRVVLAKVALLGLLSGPLNQALFLLAMQSTTAAHGALIFSLTPLGVYLVELAEGREQPRWTASLGIAVAFFGVLLLLLAHGLRALSGLFFGDVLLLASMTAWVFYTTEGRTLVASMGPLRTSAWSNIAGALWLLPAAPWLLAPHLVSASSVLAKGAVLYLALGGSVLSYLIWFAALGRTEASKVAVFSNLQPVATALAAWALLGEPIGWEVVVGGALVLFGVRLTQLPLPLGRRAP
jgi:drug/metabolite transporter (DMT)-like permease